MGFSAWASGIKKRTKQYEIDVEKYQDLEAYGDEIPEELWYVEDDYGFGPQVSIEYENARIDGVPWSVLVDLSKLPDGVEKILFMVT